MRARSLGLTLAALLLAAPLGAQEMSSSRVGAQQDWSLFRETDPVGCWAVSAPVEQANSRDGQPVSVQRGFTQLAVLYGPESGAGGQVSYTGGYPFASGSTVSLEISGTSFTLFTQDEWAFAASPEEDARIVAAMKGGSQAILSGQSGRGTATRDTFSLLGFTAMVEQAAACS